MKKQISLIICALLIGITTAYGDIVLRFGIYTADKPSVVVKQFRPILNSIEQGMRDRLRETVQIKMNVAKDYNQGIQDIVMGNVDFSRFGPASYIFAKQRNENLRILGMEQKRGKKIFRGVIAVAQNSAIIHVDELRGKRFAFGNQLSTIGRYLSQLYLLENGIRARDLGYTEYLGRHDRVGMSIASGLFDAGALKEGTFKRLVSEKQPLRAIAYFDNVTKPWIASSELPERIFFPLRESILELPKHVLSSIKKDGFLPGDDDDYDQIRQAINRTDEFLD